MKCFRMGVLVIGCLAVLLGAHASAASTDQAREAEREYQRRMAQAERMFDFVEEQLVEVRISLDQGRPTPGLVTGMQVVDEKAFAGIAVYDAVNHVQAIADFLKRVFEIWQRAQELANQATMIYHQARNLVKLDEIPFREELHIAEFLQNQGLEMSEPRGDEDFPGIAYSAENIELEIFETWRGFRPIRNVIEERRLEHGNVVLESPWDVRVFEGKRVGRAMKRTMGRVARFHDEFVRSQLALREAKRDAAASDGNRSALENVSAMTAATAEQISLLMGLMTLDVGAQTTVHANQSNEQLQVMATTERVVEVSRGMLITETGSALPVHTGNGPMAMTGLPSWY